MKKNRKSLIKAAGGLIWRQSPEGQEIALVYRDRYHGEWSLPKGKLEPGEEWVDAALREIREETGCHPEVGTYAGSISYIVAHKPKEVRYWNMELLEECNFKPSKEVQELRWVSRIKALEMLAYEDERELVRHNRRGVD